MERPLKPKELPKCKRCAEGESVIFRLENGDCGHCEFLKPSKAVVKALNHKVKHPCCRCGLPLSLSDGVYECDDCTHTECERCRKIDAEVSDLRSAYKEKGTYSRKPKQLRRT